MMVAPKKAGRRGNGEHPTAHCLGSTVIQDSVKLIYVTFLAYLASSVTVLPMPYEMSPFILYISPFNSKRSSNKKQIKWFQIKIKQSSKNESLQQFKITS